MTKELKPLKTFARSEREMIRDHFTKHVREAPIVSPLDPSSMKAWLDYVDEMRGIEQQLKDAGEHL